MVPNASTSSVHLRLCALCSYSCVYLVVLLLIFSWLPHPPLSLPGAGTAYYSDILGLIVVQVNITRQITKSKTLHCSWLDFLHIFCGALALLPSELCAQTSFFC